MRAQPDAGACEGVTATLDPGGTLTAGGSATVGIWVLEDEQPYQASRVEVVFSRVADGTIVRVAASPAEPNGRWEAVVNLPDGGTWTAAATVQGPEYAGNFALDTVHVNPPAAAPAAAGTGATTTNAASGPSVPVLPWVLVLTLAAGLAGALLLARRQTSIAQG